MPFLIAALVTALTAAFIPGASPPLVKTPIFLIIIITPIRLQAIDLSLPSETDK